MNQEVNHKMLKLRKKLEDLQSLWSPRKMAKNLTRKIFLLREKVHRNSNSLKVTVKWRIKVQTFIFEKLNIPKIKVKVRQSLIRTLLKALMIKNRSWQTSPRKQSIKTIINQSKTRMIFKNLKKVQKKNIKRKEVDLLKSLNKPRLNQTSKISNILKSNELLT